MNLKRAAQIAQESGRDSVRTIMAAIGIDSPWECTEQYLQAALLTGLWNSVKEEPSERRLRMRDEIRLDELTNVDLPDPGTLPVRKGHPLDLVIFEPLPENMNPWDRTARGVIEVKKWDNTFGNQRKTELDCQILRALADAWVSPGKEPPWVMLVALVSGDTALKVQQNAGEIEKLANTNELALQTAVAPVSPNVVRDSQIKDVWFDIVCFGR